MYSRHTFYIPVMGTGFTIDTPLKVAKYGISSVISLVDDTLIETMREHYSKLWGEKYEPIGPHDHDCRARRITAYLDMIDRIVKRQIGELKSSAFEIGSEITKYFEMLPETSPFKKLYAQMLSTQDPQKKKEIQDELREAVVPGRIDVNIMTKLDRDNYSSEDGSLLPAEFSDALAALRGFAKSTLHAAIVFSAGFNRRLYTYAAEFKDFYADKAGHIKKKIIIKVSDYRSSIIQGKFFAKKGIWISEFRVESGLNCGGHAFLSAGTLLGPILEEFRTKRQDLIESLHQTYTEALKLKNRAWFSKPLTVNITAQGGIGTAQEDQFLRSYYNLDATGWGSPFLLCPEASNLDQETLTNFTKSKEDDFYISDCSPINVPFNNFRLSRSEQERQRRIDANVPGSPCPKKHLCFNTEFTERPICTASRHYQKMKLEELARMNLPDDVYKKRCQEIVGKSCICHDLGGGVLEKYNIPTKIKAFSAVCPGPNLAYFSKIVTLREMIDHIYGKINLVTRHPRPNLFCKELMLNIEHFMHEVKKVLPTPDDKQLAYLIEFKDNLINGINYYFDLMQKAIEGLECREKFAAELKRLKKILLDFLHSLPLAALHSPALA